MSLVPLDLTDLAVATLLLLLNGLLSVMLGLGLERALALAVVRMLVQLAAVGFVLRLVLAQSSPLWTALAALAMVLVSGLDLLWRKDSARRRRWTYGIGETTLLLTGAFATVYAAGVVVRPGPWHTPQVVLPILGLILGTALTSVSLALQALFDGAERERTAIEAQIALGATRMAAFTPLLRRVLSAALTPVISVMATAGAVALPPMMAGQILAGADPVQSAAWQVMVLMMASGAAGLAAMGAALGAVLVVSDTRHRLRLDRLAAPRG